MKRILVSLDLSDNSGSLIKYALKLASVNNAGIYLLHVSFMPSFYVNDMNNYSYYNKDLYSSIERIKNISVSKLNDLAKSVVPESVNLKSKVILGYNIYFEIINYANKIKADLIIIGSHSGKKKSYNKIGSNAERVIRSTDIPVIAVNRQTPPIKLKKVVFASDFGSNSKKVYPFLQSLTMPETEVHLLYINTKSNFKEYDDIKVSVIKFIKNFNSNFKIVVRASKNIDEGIVKYANSINADLIALGVKRRKGLSLYLTDKVTEGVIGKSIIPVLAIDNP